MNDHPLCADPGCEKCGTRRALAGFRGEELTEPTAAGVTCPACGHRFVPPPSDGAVRVTESTATEAKAEIEYADPGLQSDGKKRYPLNTEDRVRSAWSYINKSTNAAKYSPPDLKKVRARIRAAMRKLDIKVSENSTTEAVINGKRSFDDVRELVRRALRRRQQPLDDTGYTTYCWVTILDITDTDVVWMSSDDRLYQCTYSIADNDVVLGEHEEVVRTYAPAGSGDEPAVEAVSDTFGARVLEAKGTDNEGHRIFSVQIIAHGDSKNGRRYPKTVLESAAAMYDGVKAFDHHRTQEEMQTGSIAGLVGYYRQPQATETGLQADLHLLPSATHAAEALDAALALQAEGKSAGGFVGISHDVFARFRAVQENGRQVQEATEITAVNSADIVSTPAAGGQATRAVAGGIDPPTDPTGAVPTGENAEESDVPPTKADLLAAFKEATDDELAAVGLTRASSGTAPATENKAGEATTEPTKATENGDEYAKASVVGRMLIRQKVEDAKLPASFVESISAALPDRVSESTIDSQIASVKTMLGGLERAGLAPTTTATVTKEAVDKKLAALDAFFDGKFSEGYRSLKHAYTDITGRRRINFDDDENRIILRESISTYDSSQRASESMSSATWSKALGDSITRRMIKLYNQPGLQTWRSIVSDVVPVSDFRTQRRIRLGGYGMLPTVNQGAPYQPLTSPTDEEALYAVMKRGGTEDLTLEMIANDDVGAVRNIPRLLGLAAAITLYRYVWDILPTNAATTYDATALFHASHNNTDNPAVLGQSTLSAGRRKMRRQAAYGDSTNVLSIVPKTIVVPPDLEELAYQLATSAVAIPGSGNASDIPNLHKGLHVEVVDYYADTNDWYLVADPSMVPTIEVGFYQGREEPELFTQADPQVGSMFDADKVTYKIRHVYAGTALDHRGFYRGSN